MARVLVQVLVHVQGALGVFDAFSKIFALEKQSRGQVDPVEWEIL